MNRLDKIKDVLKANKLRVTQSRLAVANFLLRNSLKYLTAEDIFNKINSSQKYNCDQVSVYRILTTFEEIGLVNKSIFQGEATRYILAKDSGHSGHHQHFFKCKSCSVVEPFGGCLVVKKEKELKSLGYTNLQHHLEITGVCPSCTVK